jgi:uncharacterized protein (UPF0276 family)
MTKQDAQYPVSGAGLGPENWIHVGGRLGNKFRFFAERYPILLHGLSLSIGAPSPLNEKLLYDIKAFMAEHDIRFYSEHLSYCGDDGQLYDLMPIPFTEEAVSYVAGRIRQAQDILEQRMAVENVSYYTPTDTAMTEIEFTNAVLEEADCDLLLDINNIVVNSINHKYDAREFMLAMPKERIKYFHLAGHLVEAEDLRVDTHGDAVADPVWQLLGEAYEQFGSVPTLLERDFNFPPIEELMAEIRRIKSLQAAVQAGDKIAEPAGG